MSSLDVKIPHQLPKQEALQRIQGLLKKLQQEQKDMVSNVSEQWDGDVGAFSFSAKGFDLSGLIKVGDDNVSIAGKLPFALSFFKGKIADVIKEKATAILQPSAS